jgi:hypothetical protein
VRDRFADHGACNREIRIEAWCTWSCGRCGVPPACERLFVAPYGEAAPIDQRTVVFVPVADPIPKDRVRVRWCTKTVV